MSDLTGYEQVTGYVVRCYNDEAAQARNDAWYVAWFGPDDFESAWTLHVRTGGFRGPFDRNRSEIIRERA